MKGIIGLVFASAVVAAAFSSSAYSQTRHRNYSINGRQQNQQARIYEGIRSGDLNKREAFRLERNQAQIQRMETRFRRSGDGLSYREGVRLQRELNQSSRRIYNQKHDKQQAPRP